MGSHLINTLIIHNLYQGKEEFIDDLKGIKFFKQAIRFDQNKTGDKVNPNLKNIWIEYFQNYKTESRPGKLKSGMHNIENFAATKFQTYFLNNIYCTFKSWVKQYTKVFLFNESIDKKFKRHVYHRLFGGKKQKEDNIDEDIESKLKGFIQEILDLIEYQGILPFPEDLQKKRLVWMSSSSLPTFDVKRHHICLDKTTLYWMLSEIDAINKTDYPNTVAVKNWGLYKRHLWCSNALQHQEEIKE